MITKQNLLKEDHDKRKRKIIIRLQDMWIERTFALDRLPNATRGGNGQTEVQLQIFQRFFRPQLSALAHVGPDDDDDDNDDDVDDYQRFFRHQPK